MKNTSKSADIKSKGFKLSHQDRIMVGFEILKERGKLESDVYDIMAVTNLSKEQVSKRRSELERGFKIKYVRDRYRRIDGVNTLYGLYKLVDTEPLSKLQEDLKHRRLKKGAKMLLNQKPLLSNTLISELEKLNKIL